jgi:dolichol-phosphate mannosyltransferase
MVRHSVIIPQRDRGDDLRRQLPQLVAELSVLEAPFEIVVVDDGSQPATRRLLEKLMHELAAVRIVQLDRPSGTSVALSAGIEASRGEIVIAMEAGNAYTLSQLEWLLVWLERGDLIVGRRRCVGLQKLVERVARLPRWLLLGLESHDPDCLFWAARREAVANLQLLPGMARYLPVFVSKRGFRVCEAYVEHVGPRNKLQDVRPNPGDLLAAWWQCRRWRETTAQEVAAPSPGFFTPRLVGVDDRSQLDSTAKIFTEQAKSA